MSKKEKAPFELTTASCNIYLLYDKKRSIFINPLPIDTMANAKYLFKQLLHTDGTYAYHGFDRFDLYKLCSYTLKDGVVHQLRNKPKLVRRGSSCK